MSDERLRQLERRWRETRAIDDEAAYLAERVRAGHLTEECLSLAAHCGHVAARRAIQGRPGEEPVSLKERVYGLAKWGKETCVRASVAAAGVHASTDAMALHALNAASEWLACPCDSHRNAAQEAAFHTLDARAPTSTRVAGFAAAAAGAGAEDDLDSGTAGGAAAKDAFQALHIVEAERGPEGVAAALAAVAQWALERPG